MCGFHVERTPHTDLPLVLPRFPIWVSDRPDAQTPLRSLRGRADARHVSRGTHQCADGWCPCGTMRGAPFISFADDDRRELGLQDRPRTVLDVRRGAGSALVGANGAACWVGSTLRRAERRAEGGRSRQRADSQRRRRRLARPSGRSERHSGLSQRVPRSGRGARSSSAGDRAGASSGRRSARCRASFRRYATAVGRRAVSSS
jgi:hypothetical protein